MNKKIKLLIIFIFSFIILSNNVLAERSKIYDGYTYTCDEGYNIDKDTIYCCPNTFYYQEWHEPAGATLAGCWNDDKKDECKKKGGTITSVGSTGSTLEKCFIKRKEPQKEIKVSFSDNTGSGGRVKSKICTTKNYNCDLKFSDLIDTSSDRKYIGYSENSDCSNVVNSENIRVERNKTVYLCYSDMLAECKYATDSGTGITISYGKNDVKISPDKYAAGFSGRAIYGGYYTSGMICPNYIYIKEISANCTGTFCGGDTSNTSSYYITLTSTNCSDSDCKVAKIQNKTDFFAKPKNGEDIDTGNCTIISTEIADFINEILKWVRIIVPILLTIYGTLDFAKAVYSKEDEMKKNRDKFIKRVIAAVLVFLTPIFVNLILQLANMAWSWINPDICIK